jgi:hypothetical protein
LITAHVLVSLVAVGAVFWDWRGEEAGRGIVSWEAAEEEEEDTEGPRNVSRRETPVPEVRSAGEQPRSEAAAMASLPERACV